MKTQIRQKKIAVTGISRGAGTTFISVSLAFLLAMSNHDEKPGILSNPLLPAQVTLLEMGEAEEGKAMIYYHAGLDRRFLRGRFTDFFSLYKGGQPLPQSVNLHKGINWAVRRLGPSEEGKASLSAEDLLRFPFHQMAGEYIISDSPSLDTLQQYDLVIGVIDPMPSALYAGSRRYEILRDMETGGLPVLWAVNRDSPAVDHTAMKGYLKLKDYFSIPELDRALLYQAEYTGLLPVELVSGEEKCRMEDFAERVVEMTERKKRSGREPKRFGDDFMQLRLRK